MYNCNLVGRCIFIVVSAARAQANFPLNFMELQAFSACTSCPTTAISLPGSTSPAACGCPAWSFEETRVLNPPYASRRYFSVHHSASLLDDSDKATAWGVKQPDLSSGQWMETGADEPMHIMGIISQGRGSSALAHQYVKDFRVEY